LQGRDAPPPLDAQETTGDNCGALPLPGKKKQNRQAVHVPFLFGTTGKDAFSVRQM